MNQKMLFSDNMERFSKNSVTNGNISFPLEIMDKKE